MVADVFVSSSLKATWTLDVLGGCALSKRGQGEVSDGRRFSLGVANTQISISGESNTEVS